MKKYQVVVMKSLRHFLFAILGLGIFMGCTKEVEPSYIGKYVDLGLSVKWAQVNLGATSREDFGDYFAWGETAPKEHYSEINYEWFDENLMLTKYCSDVIYGRVDDKDVLDPEDDAATVILGEGWRMPTNIEFQELLDNCIWTWSTLNGVRGYKVTSNVPGFTDKYIFLPAGGSYIYDEPPLTNYQCVYWTSKNFIRPCFESHCLNVKISNRVVSEELRWHGLNIRPVYEK